MGESIPEDGWVVCRVFRKKNYQKTLESPKSSSTSLDSKSQTISSSNDAVLNQILLYMGGGNCKMENESNNNMNISNNNTTNNMRFLTANNNNSLCELLQERFIHLPRLDSPTLPSIPISNSPFDQDRMFKSCYQSVDDILTETEPANSVHQENKTGPNDWVTLDRLVASQLNGQVDNTSKQLSCFSEANAVFSSLCPSDDIQISHLNTAVQRSNQGSTQVYSNENDLWSSFTKSASSPSSSDPLCHLSV